MKQWAQVLPRKMKLGFGQSEQSVVQAEEMARLTANSKTNPQSTTNPKTNRLSHHSTNHHTNRSQSIFVQCTLVL